MSRGSIGPAMLNEPISTENRRCEAQRSHEENQERAYIAASRRGDRSIEARVQSARMASEIHKKRTGRGFKITDEVVIKEEMYEEENDELPRPYRLLGANMQTPSADMDVGLEAYLTNKIEISKMLAKANQDWRENEINRLFAQFFPHAVPAAQQGAITCQEPTEGYSQESYRPKSCCPAPRIVAKAAAPPNSMSTTQHRRTIRSRRRSRASSSPTSRSHRNSLKSISRPANASGSATSTTRTTPNIDSTVSPQTPADTTQLSGFAFTTEMSSEVPTALDMADDDAATAQQLANPENQKHQVWLHPLTMHEPSEMPKTIQENEFDHGFVPVSRENCVDKTIESNHLVPCVLDDESWQKLINDSTWATD